MITKRIHGWGLVSLLAFTAACEVDQPPALREAEARPVMPAEGSAQAARAASGVSPSGVAPSGDGPARDVAQRQRVPGTDAPGRAPGADVTRTAVSDTYAQHAADPSARSADSDRPREQAARGGDGSRPEAAGRAPGAGRAMLGAGPAPDDDGPSVDAEPTSGGERVASHDEDRAATGTTPEAPLRPARERFPRPSAIRGLYVNAWAAGSSARMEDLLRIARQTEVNAFVIDIKDASGYVSHRTRVPLAHEIGATGEIRIRDLPGLLDRLEREGVYPIARLVLVKDPILAQLRPELAVNDTAGGVWVDSKGLVWMNPYAQEVWDYHLDLAREVALLGFPEIQYDYVRFPDAPQEDLARAVYLGADERSKPAVIGDLLRHAREELAELDVRLTADVFGVTTSARRDVGIGQVWESFIDAVDVALPMVYPSHYWQGSFGFTAPNAHPYEIVHRALRDALERSASVEGAGRTIPWLQDFSLGQPPYTSAEVRAQIQATYDAGIDEWILWNPGSRYTELALQPVEGFEGEPFIRLANRMVPVSERWAVLDSVRVARVLADSVRAAARADSARAAVRATDAVGATLD